MRITISSQFKTRLKFCGEPAYRVAVRAGIHPSLLSKLLSGQERIKPDDPRVIRVGKELGLTPHECFTTREVWSKEQRMRYHGIRRSTPEDEEQFTRDMADIQKWLRRHGVTEEIARRKDPSQ